MIRINLLAVKEAEQAAGRRLERVVGVGVIVLAALILLFFFLRQNREVVAARSRVADLERELAAMNARNKEVVELERLRKQSQEKLKIITDLANKRVGPVQILKDLSEAIPPQAWLTEFSDAGGAATITGLALDNQTVALFARRLSGSSYFVEVDPVETTQVESEGVKLQKFVLKSQLRYFGRDGAKEATEEPAPGAPQGRGA